MSGDYNLGRGRDIGYLLMQFEEQKVGQKINVKDCLFSIYSQLPGNVSSFGEGRIQPRVRFLGDLGFFLIGINESVKDSSGVRVPGTRNYQVIKHGFEASVYNLLGFSFESTPDVNYPMLKAPYLHSDMIGEGNEGFVAIELRVPIGIQKPTEIAEHF